MADRLFFKTVKQTLNVKTFIGTSENALKIQIWTAMISLLVIKWLHYMSSGKLSLTLMSTILRMNLFTRRLLEECLKDPNEAPPDSVGSIPTFCPHPPLN